MQISSLVELQSIQRVLTAHLEAVATKNVDLLRNSFTPYALFVGTDDSERWSLDHLANILAGTKNGWDMTACTSRTIQPTPLAGMVTFFETIVHEKYGPLRGSGLLVRGTDWEWRIAQYVLSFSVPNEVVKKTNILELLVS